MKLMLTLLLFGVSAMAADFSKPTPELIAKGKGVYTTSCATCHGEKGDGKGLVPMTPEPRNFTDAKALYKGVNGKGKKKNPSAKEIYDAVTKGVANTSMAAQAHLSDEDRWSVTHYIRSEFMKK